MLAGAAVLGLGAGPLVGIASAAPAARTTCGSFQYQEDAQAALRAGGHGNLDGDGDGIACESLPHRGSAATTAPVVAQGPAAPVAQRPGSGTRGTSSTGPATRPAISDLDCRDFTSQAQAQGVLDRDRSDPNRLDADHDGTACETYPDAHRPTTGAVRAVTAGTGSSSGAGTSAGTGTSVATPVETTAAAVPVGGVAAGDGSTGGDDALWYGLLGTAAVAGAAGAHQLVGGRRRRQV